MTSADLRRIALSYEGVIEGDGKQIGYSVVVKGKPKGIFWEWLERIDPKKARQPNPEIYAFKTAGQAEKLAWIDAVQGTDKWVDDPHYANYPALVVRLSEINEDELRELIEQSLRSVTKKPAKP